MAFVPEQEKEVQERQFNGEWKVCRRSGCEVLMGHAADPEFGKENRRLEAAERRRLGLTGRHAEKPLPDESKEEVMLRAITNKLAKDWRGVNNPDGSPIPFSAETCYQTAKAYWKFRADLADLVVAMGDEEAEERETVAKN